MSSPCCLLLSQNEETEEGNLAFSILITLFDCAITKLNVCSSVGRVNDTILCIARLCCIIC